ncbi:ferredoxin reductase [Rhodococcoides kyotonense]|uniref:Ferredoxin-NADP reductase n=1 Tax=Rhodococcoides kyotonense TaxID=398843 RepID=A0A239HDY0_9NOCA|nr:FAD-binding oxidoreductase [Rhodococcus kyotonensis]SNS79003.1 Ferredoxin-NADP reductase [Rhodococcus kyotonensis]
MTLQQKSRRSRFFGKFSALSLFEAMATPHELDRYLELVDPMTTVRDLRAEVVDVHRSTDDTVTLTLRPTWQWKGFEAGQFVQVGVVVDGVRHTRCYSPACSQYRSDGHIEITVKAHPDGVVSGYLHREARPGLVVGLSQAEGAFRVPTPRPERLLLLSGGSGITPVLSMLRSLLDEGCGSDITFVHYARTERDVPYRRELDDIARTFDTVRKVYVYTEQDSGGDLHGHFGREHLDAVAPWFADAQTFLCGPPGLTKAVTDTYDGLGLADRVHVEEFAAPAVAVTDDADGQLTFSESKVVAENSGRTLLEQAEDAGLSPAYGCRMGICFTCTSVKTSGCTKNVKTGEVDVEPDKEIQLCVSVPVGDVALDI